MLYILLVYVVERSMSRECPQFLIREDTLKFFCFEDVGASTSSKQKISIDLPFYLLTWTVPSSIL